MYWINFFASTVDHTAPPPAGSASDFVYDEHDASGEPFPVGEKFQIPKEDNP